MITKDQILFTCRQRALDVINLLTSNRIIKDAKYIDTDNGFIYMLSNDFILEYNVEYGYWKFIYDKEDVIKETFRFDDFISILKVKFYLK